MTNTPSPRLRPAIQEEIEHALAHALRFNGKKAFKLSHEMMANITASHLAECLRQSQFIIMKEPPPEPRPSPTHAPLGIGKHLTD